MVGTTEVGSGVQSEPFIDWAIFSCCWLATSFLAASAVTAVWCTRRPHAPYKEADLILWAVVACEQLSLSASELQTSSWAVVRCLFSAFPIATKFQGIRNPRSENEDGQSGGSHIAAVDESLS